jgi:hypothetical protein
VGSGTRQRKNNFKKIFKIRYLVKKGLCPKICITVLCNKGLVSQDSSTVEKESFDPVPRSEEPLIPSMSKIV